MNTIIHSERKRKGKAERRKRVKEKHLKYVYNLKKESGCEICGNRKIENLTFHHRNRKTKTHRISNLYGRSWTKLLNEILKCDIVCLKCHRKIHRNDR